MNEMVHISKVEYEGLKESLEILKNQKIVTMISESQKNIILGKTQTLEEFMAEIED